MNKRIKTYCPLIFWFILLAACHQSKVGTDSLVLALSDSGTVSGIDFGQKADVPVVAYTTLTGCKQQSGTKRIDERGYMTFERIFEDSAKNTCKVIDRFSKVPGAVIWEVEVQGSGKPWTTGINTVVNYPATEQSACWTTWSAMEKSNGQWRDPLRPKPFENLHLTYGGGEILDPNSMVIPMISVFENDGRTGFTVLQSLQDTILDLSLITDTAGRMVFKRENHKISRESTVRFKMHLFSHGLDWRSGLDFCTKTYPQYFNAVSKQTDRVAGGAAYSSWEGALDTAKLNQMGFKFNWKATFDFPYMGMFLPEVASTSERWERFHQGGVKVGGIYVC